MQTNENQRAPEETSRNSPPGGAAGPILVLEGALGGGGAAVVLNGAVAALEAVPPGGHGRTLLFGAASRALRRAGAAPPEIAAIAVGTGPGSFTGLRVALGLASGLAAAAAARPEFLAADSLALVTRAAGVTAPAFAAIPWGRHRVLVGRPGGLDVALVTRDEVGSLELLSSRTVAVPDGLGDLGWPGGATLAPALMGGLEALCALVVEGAARSCGSRLPSPSYFAPPDAVLPARATARGRDVVLLDARDAASLAALDAACFARPWSAASMRDELSADSRRIAVGVRGPDGGLAGAALGREQPDAFEIVRVAVAPGERRRGLGRALVAALLDAARAHGASRVDLEVRAADAAAVGLYARAGFVEVGRRPSYYGPGEDGLLMSLVLARRD